MEWPAHLPLEGGGGVTLSSILGTVCHCLHRRYLGVLEKRVGA